MRRGKKLSLFDQAKALSKDYTDRFNAFVGPPGSTSANIPQIRLLMKAGGIQKKGILSAAPLRTNPRWFGGKYPKYWKYIFAPGGLGNRYFFSAGRNTRGKERIVRVKHMSAHWAWTKTKRPVGRLRRNILVKVSKQRSQGDTKAVNIYVRFSRKLNKWDRHNAWYARFLEDGTASGRTAKGQHWRHIGISSTKGWFKRGQAVALEEAEAVLRQGMGAWVKQLGKAS